MNVTRDVNKISISHHNVIFAVFEKINLSDHTGELQIYGRTNCALFKGIDTRGEILLKFSLFLNIGNFVCDIIVANLEAIDILTQFFTNCFLEENRRSCDNIMTVNGLLVTFKINKMSQCVYTMRRVE